MPGGRRPAVGSLVSITPGRDEHVVLDHRVRRDVAAGLDPHARADHHVVVHRRAAPHHRPVADPARSRTWAWSPTTRARRSRAPATTTAPAQIVAPVADHRRRGGASRAARRARRRAPAACPPRRRPGAARPRRPRCPAWITTLPPISTSSGSSTPSPSSRPGARSDGAQRRRLRALRRASAAAPRAPAPRAAPLSPPERGSRPVAHALDEVRGTRSAAAPRSRSRGV